MCHGFVFSDGLGVVGGSVALHVYPYQRHDAYERSSAGAMGE